jgi:hypothetical protein
MNVRPANYAWAEFYDRLVDLTSYSFSWRAIGRRLGATREAIPRWMNVVRAVSSEGWGRIAYHKTIRGLLDTDPSVRDFMEGTSDRLPAFYAGRIEREMGELHQYLPDGATMHDPNAYLKSVDQAPPTPLRRARRAGAGLPAPTAADLADA